MARFDRLETFLGACGGLIGRTEWRIISQDDVDRFAALTGDQQWIHVDQQRARRESPFGDTVAHGALTLSLCTGAMVDLLDIDDVTLIVNAGLNRVRFRSPVLVGSRMRIAAHLSEVSQSSRGAMAVIRLEAEIEGQTGPACVAEQVLLFEPRWNRVAFDNHTPSRPE